MKHPGGRPTEYTPEVIEELAKYIAEAIPENMDIPTVEGFAIKIGVSKKTLYNWGNEHTEFLHALEQLKMLQKQHLIRIGIFGGKEINATIVALLLKVNHNMVETTKTDVTSGGRPLTSILGNGVPTSNSNGEASEANQEN